MKKPKKTYTIQFTEKELDLLLEAVLTVDTYDLGWTRKQEERFDEVYCKIEFAEPDGVDSGPTWDYGLGCYD